jgi:hypothetical protein
MTEHNKVDTSAPSDIPSSERKKRYSPPRLVRHGDIRGMTQGGSPGGGDSGSAVTIQNPPAFGKTNLGSQRRVR